MPFERQVPTEVDFAARYFAGDWTEGDPGRRRQAWMLGEDDDPIVIWRTDEGPYMVLTIGEGQMVSVTELVANGERVLMRHTNGDAWILELQDDGVIMEISAPDAEMTREEFEFEQGWNHTEATDEG